MRIVKVKRAAKPPRSSPHLALPAREEVQPRNRGVSNHPNYLLSPLQSPPPDDRSKSLIAATSPPRQPSNKVLPRLPGRPRTWPYSSLHGASAAAAQRFIDSFCPWDTYNSAKSAAASFWVEIRQSFGGLKSAKSSQNRPNYKAKWLFSGRLLCVVIYDSSMQKRLQ